MPSAISDDRWAEAQAGELHFWQSANRAALCQKLDTMYAEWLGINETMAKGRTVLDVGGGPMPLGVLFDLPLKAYTVLDPLPHVETGIPNHLNMIRVQCAAEEFTGGQHDEAWGYNVLQHVIDPAAVIATAKAHANVVRWFDWVDTPIESHHPHSVSAQWITAQFADWQILSNCREYASKYKQTFCAIVARRP